jgi:predicted alpha/beta-fold hydrolase
VRFVQVMAGHFWTIAPALRHLLRPMAAPPWQRWSTTFAEDGRCVRVKGRLHAQPDADTLLIVLHGLGGDPDSHYCVRAAKAVWARGWSCLRLALRGADGNVEDFYHAGLTSDLCAALQSEEVARHSRVFVIGYSLGGHVALRSACASCLPRVAAVAAICAPLDLTRGATVLDERVWPVYRHNILWGLQQAYASAALSAKVPTPVERVRRARKIREWDALTVVPRFGFSDVEDYYSRESVAPRLQDVKVPTLLVYSRWDPLVPASTVLPAIETLPSTATVWWLERGGHTGFPPRVALNGHTAPVEHHVLDWCDSHPG